MNTFKAQTPDWMELMTSQLTRNELRDYLKKAVPENIRIYQPGMSQTEVTERLAIISLMYDEALLDLVASAIETMPLAELSLLTGVSYERFRKRDRQR